jgi:hypothetical protein
MCQRTTCSTCGKSTFAGCGRHVEQVLGDVPPAERCQCRERSAKAPGSGVLGGAASRIAGLFRTKSRTP